MVILDTNIVSELMQQRPHPAVTLWLDRQPEISVWTTSLTVFEIRHGIEMLPRSRRRTSLESEFERVIEDDIQRRIVSFDTAAAHASTILMAERQRAGRPGDLRDTMIAGIVIASHATLATRNTRHFADLPVPVIDPWHDAAR
jgi:predicted nucleic acid-binding protein